MEAIKSTDDVAASRGGEREDMIPKEEEEEEEDDEVDSALGVTGENKPAAEEAEKGDDISSREEDCDDFEDKFDDSSWTICCDASISES
jgi:hypothetical protein